MMLYAPPRKVTSKDRHLNGPVKKNFTRSAAQYKFVVRPKKREVACGDRVVRVCAERKTVRILAAK